MNHRGGRIGGGAAHEPRHAPRHERDRRLVEDGTQAVVVDPADGLAIVPPQPGHVHELGVLLEQVRQTVRVAPVPGLHLGLGDALGMVER